LQVGAVKKGDMATWRHIGCQRGDKTGQFASDVWFIVPRRADVVTKCCGRTVSLRRQYSIWCWFWDHVSWLSGVTGQETNSHRYVACFHLVCL